MSDGNAKWLVTLGVGLAVSLAVNTYFIGRYTVADEVVEARVFDERAAYREPDMVEATGPARQVLAYGDRRDPGAARLEQGASGELVIQNTAPPPSTRVSDDGDRASDQASIAAYFAELDVLSTNTSGPSAPEYAQKLIQASLNGDTTELKKLQRELETMRGDLKRLSPPPACAAYHEKSLALLTTSAGLLAGLEQAFRTKDTAGLGRVAQTAQNLQSQTVELQKMRKRLLEG